VRVGLVPDVPEDLVARGLEHGVQGDGQLAGAEVGAEVTADLADGVDDVLAHLLGDLHELLLGELVQVLGTVDLLEQAHEVLVKMKSAMSSSSAVASLRDARAATSASASRAIRCDSAASSLARSTPNSLTYVRFP